MTEQPGQNEEQPAGKPASTRLFTTVVIAIIGVTLCCFTASQGLNA